MADTATAHISLDNGIVRVRIRAGARQRPSDARENMDTALHATAGQRRPMLVDITQCGPLDAETRRVYSGQRLVDGFTALAFLIEDSPLGRMIGNVNLRVVRPGIPTQIFAADARAVEWLHGYLS
jgi:hypothetical protein